MAPRVIFRPVVVLALWTFLVLLGTAARRFLAVYRRQVSPRDFALGESARVPAEVAIVNRNFMNLLEMPVLFYVACLVAHVSRQVNGTVLALAWVYVGLRVCHTLVHLSFNNVRHRLVVFA